MFMATSFSVQFVDTNSQVVGATWWPITAIGDTRARKRRMLSVHAHPLKLVTLINNRHQPIIIINPVMSISPSHILLIKKEKIPIPSTENKRHSKRRNTPDLPAVPHLQPVVPLSALRSPSVSVSLGSSASSSIKDFSLDITPQLFPCQTCSIRLGRL